MESKEFCCFEFGEFSLDSRRRSLSKNGEKVSLPARNFDLLLYMVENGGRVLEHDELLDKVWAGTFVEQATLKKGISALRQILGEKPDNEFIKTIPRRGYSFISPVRIVPETNETFFVRETEQEIIVEEYEETDEQNISAAPEKIIEVPAASHAALPSADKKKTKISQWAITGTAGFFALLLAFFGFQSFLSKNVQPQFSVENVRVNRITNSGKVTAGATISPDGNYVLYTTDGKEGASLWLRQMSTNTTNRLTQPVKGSFWGFIVAPDNSYVYYIFNNQAEPQKSGLYKLPLLGGESRRIAENVSSILISPDGKKIALVRLTDQINIFTVNSDGENEQPITTFPSGLTLLGASWTPDGNSVLCTLRKIVEGKPLFYISEIAADGGRETVILPPQEKIIFGAIWTPDKNAILLTVREPHADINQIWQYLPSSAEWRRVTNDSNSYKYVSLSQDGKTIVSMQISRLAAIWLTSDLPIEKKNPEKKSLLNNSDSFRQITEGSNNLDWLSWLADNRILYSSTDESEETLSTINADGTNHRKITGGEDGIWIFPNATGGGEKISFISSRTGIKQVWRIDADGKNPVQMTESDRSVFGALILRDNSTVIYAVQQSKGMFLFKKTAAGQVTQLTDTDTGAFAISADEKILAMEIADKATGKSRTELRSMEDGKVIKAFDFVSRRQLRFTPDGKNLAYDATYGELSQIMIQPLDGGEPFPLTDFQSDDIFSFDWSRDGNRLAVIRGKQLSDVVLIKSNNR